MQIEKVNEFGKEYKKLNGIYYGIETTDAMVQLLEQIRLARTRVRFYFGNAETGEDWDEIHDIRGRIGNSTGSIKIPLLVYNSRSYGGPALLTDCIVKIETTKGKRVLYQHPKYHVKIES